MSASDCGFPFPSGNSDFSLLQWEPLDPAQHEALISDIFYWHNALNSREWDYATFHDLQLSRRYREINQEMKSKVWGPASAFVDELIAQGRFRLERAHVEMIVPGGGPFWLYRMTPVFLNRTVSKEDRVPPIIVSDDACLRTDTPGAEPRFIYYASPDENIFAHFYFRQRGRDGDARYFLWRGLPFRYKRNQVSFFHPKADPDQFGDFYAESFCRLNN
jgi:hypothetical protein